LTIRLLIIWLTADSAVELEMTSSDAEAFPVVGMEPGWVASVGSRPSLLDRLLSDSCETNGPKMAGEGDAPTDSGESCHPLPMRRHPVCQVGRDLTGSWCAGGFRVRRMWMPQLPQPLRWDHNAHYHRWLVRQLPQASQNVLDVGCGAGGLAAKVAARAGHVDAVDVSPPMIARARTLHGTATNIRWVVGDLLDPAVPLEHAGYDLVTAVSSLHHMPLRPALGRLAGLVRPGGTLAVIGFYHQTTLADHALEALAMPANAAVGAVLALQGRAGKPHAEGMPTREPDATLTEIRDAAAEHLPGAHLRRRLYWRYSLLWHRDVTCSQCSCSP